MRCTLQGVGGSQGSHRVPNGDDMTPWDPLGEPASGYLVPTGMK
jgi:hypothetical protein